MMNLSIYSHIGNSRENQEDNFLALKNNLLTISLRDSMAKTREGFLKSFSSKDEKFCLAISDGMGGYENGETASLFAVSYISNHYEELMQNSDSKDFLEAFVSKLNDDFCDFARKDKSTQDMGATLCAVVGSQDGLIALNVGDSRLYEFTENHLSQITVDNTEGERLVGLGLLTKEELKNFPNRKAIYRYLGMQTTLIPDLYDLGKIQKGTVLLLCSDGLSDALSYEDISRILSYEHLTLEDKAKQLVNEALEQHLGFGDNITLILAEFV